MPAAQVEEAARTLASGKFEDALFSRNGARLYAASKGAVSVIHVASGDVLATYSIGKMLGGMDVSADGRHLAVVERQPEAGTGIVYVIDLTSGETISYSTPLSSGAFFDASFLSDGTLLISRDSSYGNGDRLRLLDPADGSFTSIGSGNMAVATLSSSRNDGLILAGPVGFSHDLHLYQTGIGITASVSGIPDPYAGASLPRPSRGVQAISENGELIAQGYILAVYDGDFQLQHSLGAAFPYLRYGAAHALAFAPDADTLYLLTSTHVIAFETAGWEAVASYRIGDETRSGGAFANYGNVLHTSLAGTHLSVIGGSGIQLIDLATAAESGAGGDLLRGTGKLYGLGGDDDIAAAAGASATMFGGEGDDLYQVSASDHRIVEINGQGHDTVRSSVAYALSTDVEDLILVGANATRGTGNNVANVITGSTFDNELSGRAGADVIQGGAGQDLLDGGTGADRLTGGQGDDVFRVDNAADVVREALGQGSDTIEASVSFVLSAHVETLTLIGYDRINGTGNQLANVLIGNNSHNILNGLGGADRMEGGRGNDTYYIGGSGDVILEAENAGIDTVFSAASTMLTDNLENLTLTGTAAAGSGNALANVITGNASANSLRGLGGADRLNGGAGKDTMIGGTGADRFTFDTSLDSHNVDRISDFAADDLIILDRSMFKGINANGALSASAFRAGSAAADATDRIIYDQGTGRIFYDSDGNGAGAAVLFARVEAGTVLTHADFFAVA